MTPHDTSEALDAEAGAAALVLVLQLNHQGFERRHCYPVDQLVQVRAASGSHTMSAQEQYQSGLPTEVVGHILSFVCPS